jgi:hypothetical protein
MKVFPSTFIASRLAVIGDDGRKIERIGDYPLLPLENLTRPRPGNGRSELDGPGRRHALTIAQPAASLHK